MTLNRRGLLLGLASALAAPAIVHAGNLMPVKAIPFQDPSRVMADLMNDLYYGDTSFAVRRSYWCSLGGKICYHDITADEFYVA